MSWLATWIDHLDIPSKIWTALSAIGAILLLIPQTWRYIGKMLRKIKAAFNAHEKLDKMQTKSDEEFKELKKLIEHWGSKLERGILNQILTRRVLLDREKSNAFCEFDAEGRCLWVSRLFKEVTGLDGVDAKGNGWILGIHPDEQREIVEEWRAAVSEQRGFERTITYIDRKGNTCPMRVYGSPLVNEETNELLSYAMHSLK